MEPHLAASALSQAKVFLVLFPCAAPSPSHLKKELLPFLPLGFLP
jgi:hypothetical protein